MLEAVPRVTSLLQDPSLGDQALSAPAIGQATLPTLGLRHSIAELLLGYLASRLSVGLFTLLASVFEDRELSAIAEVHVDKRVPADHFGDTRLLLLVVDLAPDWLELVVEALGPLHALVVLCLVRPEALSARVSPTAILIDVSARDCFRERWACREDQGGDKDMSQRSLDP